MIKKDHLFYLGVVLSVINAFLVVCIAYILKQIVDSSTTNNLSVLYQTILLALVYILITALVGFINKIVQNKIVEKNLIKTKHRVFTCAVTEASYESSEIISLLSNDLNILENDYYRNIFDTIYYLANAIVAFCYLIYLSVWLTGVVIITSLIPFIVTMFTKKIISQARLEYTYSMTNFVRSIKEYILGIGTIHSFNITNKVLGKYQKINVELENKRYRFSNILVAIGVLNNTFGSLVFITTMAVGTYLVIIGSITLGTMIATIQLTNYLVSPIMQIANNLNRFNSVKGIIAKFQKLNKIHYQENITAKHKQVDFKNNIILKNIYFAYNENRVLSDVSYIFEKNKKYLLIGDSGSGKSTLLKIIMKSLSPNQGLIEIDGKDIAKIDYSERSDYMAMIHQDIFLFNDTIYNNITLYNSFSKNTVVEVMKKAKLDKYINDWNYIVTEGGQNLSGGEKQRIAIARAILRGTPILIIDEMTSSLDTKTAIEIEKTILSLKNTTCIIVAHNISFEILSMVDKVIKLQDGKLTPLSKEVFGEGIARPKGIVG